MKCFILGIEYIYRINMSAPRIYRIFISHAWESNPDYERFVGVLNNAPLFTWQNCSAPDEVAFTTGTQKSLEKQLQDQIKPAQIVVLISCMKPDYRYWIQKEVDVAQEMKKPIIGVLPSGNERTLNLVQNVSNNVVGWDEQSIVGSIKKHSM